MIIKKERHIHQFKKISKKIVPVRKAEGGISAHDTIYFYKCEGKKCEETQPFNMTRELK